MIAPMSNANVNSLEFLLSSLNHNYKFILQVYLFMKHLILIIKLKFIHCIFHVTKCTHSYKLRQINKYYNTLILILCFCLCFQDDIIAENKLTLIKERYESFFKFKSRRIQ